MAEKSEASATVKTDLGTVQGIPGAVRTFRGVPYGAPATGNLRWAPPQPAQPWSGVRDATQWGADTFQPPPGPTGATRAAGMSEDCLNLNIWTPAHSADEKLPVLFWIPGGGFLTCYSSNPAQDGERLAAKGAVVVSLNARTNVFGWLAHPELSKESAHKVSGNYGLLDVMAALRWVKRNIGAFGGDPNRVTIFGVSSGGATAALLMVSPPAQGLFEQAILESPGAFRPLATLRDAEQAALTNLGPDLAALRATPADEITKKIGLFVPKMRGLTTPRVLRPINDGSYILPDDERELFYAGKYRAIPIIVGGVTDEGSNFIGGWPIKSVADFRGTMEQNFSEVLEQALKLYPTGGDADVPAQMAHVFGDCQFHYGAWGIAKANAARQPATYRFMLTRHRGGGAKPPVHGGEVGYVFGTLPETDAQRGAHDQKDAAISDAMMEYWVRFAATGNPNGGSLPNWPAYNASTEEFMDFGETVGAQRRFRSEHMEFLDKLYSERVKARQR